MLDQAVAQLMPMLNKSIKPSSVQPCHAPLFQVQAIVDAWAPAFGGGPSQPKAVRGAAVAMLGNLAVLTHPDRKTGVLQAVFHKLDQHLAGSAAFQACTAGCPPAF